MTLIIVKYLNKKRFHLVDAVNLLLISRARTSDAESKQGQKAKSK
jgi:hypothetical protein